MGVGGGMRAGTGQQGHAVLRRAVSLLAERQNRDAQSGALFLLSVHHRARPQEIRRGAPSVHDRIRPEFDGLVIDPCIPGGWDGFTAVRRFRGAVYEIEVRNPAHVCKGVKALYLDGVRVERLPLLAPGTTGRVTAVLG